jgi:hypothetical protein
MPQRFAASTLVGRRGRIDATGRRRAARAVAYFMPDESRSIGSFRVNVYHRSSADPVADFVGTGDEWRLRSSLRTPIIDETYTVRVDGVWSDLLQGDQDRIEQDIEGLATIVKFGDTMQLREPFRVVIEINL